MKLLHTQRKLTVIAMTLTIPLFLLSCSEEAEEKEIHHVESILAKTANNPPEKLQREAQEGNIEAQYELAYMYENGLGVPKDESKGGCKKFCVNRHFAGNCNFQKWNKNDYTIIIT